MDGDQGMKMTIFKQNMNMIMIATLMMTIMMKLMMRIISINIMIIGDKGTMMKQSDGKDCDYEKIDDDDYDE
jgi:hypothetical protein